MSDSICHIDLDRVDDTDTRFRFGDNRIDTADLAASIKDIGQLHPVWLKPDKQRFIIVSGFNRVAACRQAGLNSVMAAVMDDTADDKTCMVRSVSVRAFASPLPQPELIRALAVLATVMDPKEMADRSRALLNISLSEPHIRQLLGIGTLDPALPDLLNSNRISLKTAKALVGLSGADRSFFIGFFSRIRASVSLQKEMVTHLLESARRDKTDLVHLAEQTGIEAVLASQELDEASKTAQVRQILMETRFPSLSRAREKRQTLLKSLNPGQGISFQADPNFEDPKLRVSFAAGSKAEFKDRVAQMVKMGDNDALEKVFQG